MTVPQFLSSPLGRGVRVAAGAALIAIGIWLIGGTVGIVIAVIGVVPLLAGLFDFCLLGALFFGTPLSGEAIRQGVN